MKCLIENCTAPIGDEETINFSPDSFNKAGSQNQSEEIFDDIARAIAIAAVEVILGIWSNTSLKSRK